MRDQLAQYVPRVFRFLLQLSKNRTTAEDLTQEVFLRAWSNRDQLRNLEAIRVWLFRIASNVWTDYLRRHKRMGIPELLDEEQAGDEIAPDQQFVHNESIQRAMQALASLPPRQHQVLYLHACQELSVAEIAEVLDIETDAVKSSISLARKQMRKNLKDLAPEYSRLTEERRSWPAQSATCSTSTWGAG